MLFMYKDKTYNRIKILVQMILPAISALYFGLASIWGLPDAEKVVGTIAAFTTFLGICLGISSKQYHESDAAYDGSIVVSTPKVGKKRFSLELNGDPDDLEGKEFIRFKVKSDTEEEDERLSE